MSNPPILPPSKQFTELEGELLGYGILHIIIIIHAKRRLTLCWIVTFAIDEREGEHSAGYISSGFVGGLMLGRIGERRVIYVYCIVCIGIELVIWLVPNLAVNAVAVTIAGLLLG
ncbi:hypothetical protein OPQ81_000120 [Rhizoctonia solani]|nr:hypothetical protein OPQ81_000120 [Rhizoctonia solani]